MARGLKLDLIAEGVETKSQLRYLRSQGCHEVQGFFFSQPVKGAEMVALLRDEPYVELVRQSAEPAATV